MNSLSESNNCRHVTWDDTHTYTYDGEGRVCAVKTSLVSRSRRRRWPSFVSYPLYQLW